MARWSCINIQFTNLSYVCVETTYMQFTQLKALRSGKNSGCCEMGCVWKTLFTNPIQTLNHAVLLDHIMSE